MESDEWRNSEVSLLKSFDNKVAVVTGAASGIGQALVVELAKRGALLAYCDVADMTTTNEKVQPFGRETLAATVDIGSKPEIEAFRDRVIQHFGRAELLVNNAGIALGERTFEEATPEDFERITNINYWGVVHTTQMFYPCLLEQAEAAIVNLSSAQGVLAAPYLVPYCTTKFAVRGFTDALRTEHKIRGIDNVSVHCVHPGAVATDITLNADYQGVNSRRFHEQLQVGTSPEKAAGEILEGVLKSNSRIFIGDGVWNDRLARLLPKHYYHVIRWVMKRQGVAVR
tara:strand:+ start:151907 stop:152761 length:855 start_codon:yes stop_codon:yes gene_type:complete